MRAFSFGVALLGLSALVAPMSAQAGLIGGTADFREVLDLPSFGSGPRVLETIGRTIDGTSELTEANQTSNPSNWGDSLTANLGDFSLSLTPTASNTYQTIQFTISNIATLLGEVITGFTQTGFDAIDASTPAYTNGLLR